MMPDRLVQREERRGERSGQKNLAVSPSLRPPIQPARSLHSSFCLLSLGSVRMSARGRPSCPPPCKLCSRPRPLSPSLVRPLDRSLARSPRAMCENEDFLAAAVSAAAAAAVALLFFSSHPRLARSLTALQLFVIQRRREFKRPPRDRDAPSERQREGVSAYFARPCSWPLRAPSACLPTS